MDLDIKTLLLSSILVTVVYGCGLTLYRAHQKTFPGFGYWIGSFFILSLGYFSLLARDFVPLILSVILGNLFFGLGALLRLDGVHRFTRNKSLTKIHYSTLFLFIFFICFFYLVIPNIVIRTSIVGIYTSAIAFGIAYCFIKSAPLQNKRLFHTAAILTILMASTLLIGPLLFRSPTSTDLFQMGNRYAIYYLIVLAYEISWGLCLVMINNQRVESELKEAERELRKTNLRLEKTIKEKITLSGLLPICAHCKKIRDDKGYWNHLESYIETHSEADFSHSICPECANTLYPDLDLTENED